MAVGVESFLGGMGNVNNDGWVRKEEEGGAASGGGRHGGTRDGAARTAAQSIASPSNQLNQARLKQASKHLSIALSPLAKRRLLHAALPHADALPFSSPTSELKHRHSSASSTRRQRPQAAGQAAAHKACFHPPMHWRVRLAPLQAVQEVRVRSYPVK